jgi:hypothetical protein
LDRVREAARRDKDARFTALLHHVTLERLHAAYRAIRPQAAAGIDGVTWASYGQDLEANLREHLAYYAVPGNAHAVDAFRFQLIRRWLKALRRRSQRHRLNWERMLRLAQRWLPTAKIMHPYPEARFAVRT